MTETHILIFLLQVALLLGFARALGEVFRRFGQPSITAEILVGIFFGPTILGRISPEAQEWLFPKDEAQVKMLGTMAWMGILLFLLKAGLETNFATAWRQRHHAMRLSLCDLTIPMVIAFIPCLFLPEIYMGEDGSPVMFALFVSVIMTISALPVTARVLQDLKIYRTDLGLLIMSALTINDVAGWIVFAIILGFVNEEMGMTPVDMIFVVGATLVFATFCLSLGSKWFNKVLGVMQDWKVPEPSGSLSLVVVTGLLCGAATTWIGIHALFGFFIGGIMAGEAVNLSQRTRHVFSQLVQAILVPLFFAAIGLKLDFLENFDFMLVLFILGIGIVGRYLAAYVGGRLIGQPSLHSRLIADAHIPGGEMQIIIGMLALEYGVITETVYVAIVFGAIFTSVISGPLMERLLRQIEKIDWLAFLPVDHVLPDLQSRNPEDVIREICLHAGEALEPHDLEAVTQAVLHREGEMSTALEDCMAVPHARLEGLARPVVFFGRSIQGIDWNSADGRSVRLIFLILTPKDQPDAQIQILQGIAKTLRAEVRNKVCEAPTGTEILEQLRAGSIESAKRKKH
ncbi:MAG: cation:proton antiporter [Kiritimatiellae bacterium]|nr:cation:proton antiporter [Kiritimatiellia bacterium]